MTSTLLVTTFSCYILSMTILIKPLIMSKQNFPLNMSKAAKTAFFISLLPLISAIDEGLPSLTYSAQWVSVFSTSMKLTMQLDSYSFLFIPVALLVSWNIIEYSLWYMQDDAMMDRFFKYLLIFLTSMVLLVLSGNLVTLFIGWEGVGIMSYLLIGWYFTRSNSGSAALQAVLYNRVGDIGFLFTIFWMFSSGDSMDLDFICSLQNSTPTLMAFIIAAASKSAQFGLHPWLTAAMEGPTPVSALLHSSTMVVAGIFLLIRIHPMIQNNPTALTTCLCLGGITTSFAAMCALTQNDIKKIIAFSTSSQLGLMMVAIGLNLPHLAFFHMCTHAFFKAMLFLCAGSIIHNLDNEQDIRKMGGLQKMLPVSTSCVSVGSLALMGTPYLAGFYSKDAIIEATCSSNVNLWALILTIAATSLTAVYSLRTVYYVSFMTPRLHPLLSTDETMISPIMKRLAAGSIIAGAIMHQMILPSSQTTLTLPTYLKVTAVLASLLGFLIALDLAHMTRTKTPMRYHLTKADKTLFFSAVVHRLLPSSVLNFGLRIVTNLFDSSWLEKIGPKGLSKIQLPSIITNQDIQRGSIKVYLSVFAVTSVILMIALQLA